MEILVIPSKKTGKTVVDIIKEAFPVSAKLGLISLIFAEAVGLFFGILCAQFRGKWPDYLLMVVAVLGIALPSMVLGPILRMIFWCKAWHPSGNRMGKTKSDYTSGTCSWSWNCCRKYKKYESEYVSHNNTGLCKDGKSERSFANSRRY